MDDTPTQSSPAPEPAVRQLALEYCALLADGRSTDTARFLERLETDRERRQFEEYVESAKVAITAVQDSSAPRRILNERYRLDAEIGAGGMGRVFRAFDLELERFVAVKLLSLLDIGDSEREQLLVKESKLLATLKHPNIVTVHETGRDGELVYVVMELVQGESLAKVIERIQVHESFSSGCNQQRLEGAAILQRAINRPVPDGWANLLEASSYSRSVTQVMLQVVRTIEAAHAANVVHRDLKPGNVMLVGGGNPVVLDFGLAGHTNHAAGTITQGLYGTVAYLAPEQARSQRVGADPRTDVYQLGLLLYEFLTLKRAFPDGAIGEVLERIKRGDFPEPRKLRAEVPRDLSAICLKALEVSPENRYQTAAELRADLESFLSQDRIPSAVKGSASRAALRHARIALRRHPLAFSALAMVAVAALVWFGFRSEGLVLKAPTFLAGSPDQIREITSGSKVYPAEQLGVRIDSSQPRVVYALSVFVDSEDEELRCVRPVLPDSRSSELVRVGRWGVRVEPGERFLWCAEVESTAVMEGLMLFHAEAESTLVDDWLTQLDQELGERMEGLISLEEAKVELDELRRGTGARGAGLQRISEAERARWAAQESSFDASERSSWREVGIEFNEVECVVSELAGDE